MEPVLGRKGPVLGTPGAGAQATDPVSMLSECVYTQQQPIVRRQILSEIFEVLKSADDRIHGILLWPVRGRPRSGHRLKPVRKKFTKYSKPHYGLLLCVHTITKRRNRVGCMCTCAI